MTGDLRKVTASQGKQPAGLRAVQLTLAAFWAIDALLSLQPSNFTSDLVYGTILGNAENQPRWIYDSLVSASHLLGSHAVALNVAIIVVQLTIAAGLVWRRTVTAALALSIPWALGVWWLGEGFGGVFAGKATLLVGGPGAALLYAVLALVAWPRRPAPAEAPQAVDQPGRPRPLTSSGALGERGTLVAWVLLWGSGAILRIVPFWFSPVYALAGDLQLGLDEEPAWVRHINESLSHLASGAGMALVIALAAVEAVIAVGVLTRYRRAALIAGIVVSAIYWVFGQQLAGLLTGGATDVSTGPLFVLLACTLWPRGAKTHTRVRERGWLRAGRWRPKPAGLHPSLADGELPGAVAGCRAVA